MFFTYSDRFRTVINVAGDCFGAAIVYHFSKKNLAEFSHTAPPSPTASSSPPPSPHTGNKLSQYGSSPAAGRKALDSVDVPHQPPSGQLTEDMRCEKYGDGVVEDTAAPVNRSPDKTRDTCL